MKMGIGQLICLTTGIVLLSLGGGVIGGRLAVQRYSASVPEVPGRSAVPIGSPQSAESRDVSLSQPEDEVKDKDTVPESAARSEQKAPDISPGEPSAKVKANTNLKTPAQKGPAKSSSLCYGVQVLSTQSISDARIAEGKIRARGFPARVLKADIEGKGVWYRVCVGPYKSEAETQLILKNIRSIPGFQMSFIKSLQLGRDFVEPFEGKESRE